MRVLGVDLVALGLTLALGAVGGVLAHAAHLPLGYLLGSMVLVGVLSALGAKPFGKLPTLPARLRFSFVPVIGVAIGGAFTPEVARAALGWGPSLAALFVFVPLAHALGYAVFRRGGFAPAEAFYGAVPGGLIESVQMGEEAGADVRLLIVVQTLRLILTIITVPLIFLALTGHAVGSAAGATMVGGAAPLTVRDIGLMIAAGLIGAQAGKRLRLPGYIITGPLLCSAILHVTGLMQAIPPGWLVSVTQVILGAGLGVRFVGMDRRMLARCGRLAMLNGALALGLAFGFAGVVHGVTGEPVAAGFLAFAPGGLAEMSLIALSLNMSVIYVTAHHVLRIVLAVSFAKLGRRLV
ncbi:AbrB family transcriptional regulator [Tabrizicola oligotrophica]|uniref:AbrB family transcriptional regulator n=1 Tax=Tabrizicola oligotrophica TaxID=2710650 RepID=A0A6M0QWB3_9RHOB|nr:AbrB family transcriptional regulator [Tabrizicola oligotrophica]NEY90802.1 AbrB family transcriptional regulator [Tabrizicola oligotrophica]